MSAARLTGVCLCDRIDLPALMGPAFAARAPHLALLAPVEISDPAAVDFALSFDPGDDAFAPYPNLRAIVGVGAGVERILACPSRPRGLPVIRQIDADQADQMAAFAVWHVVHWHRRMDLRLAAQARGDWMRPDVPASPRRFPVGVLGLGHLGRRIAAACAGLGHPVRGFSRSPGPKIDGVDAFHGDGLADFLAGTRCLIAVLPLTDETRGMLDARLFAGLPEGAFVVNLGRGDHVVEADLLAALDAGRLAGASLDVFAEEPLPETHPFWRDPRVLVTPHMASDPEPEAIAEATAAALADLAAGRRPRGQVDETAGY